MTPDDLREAQRSLERAVDESDDARLLRDSLIEEALADGWTHAKIAEAAGLTRARVGQIALRD